MKNYENKFRNKCNKNNNNDLKYNNNKNEIINITSFNSDRATKKNISFHHMQKINRMKSCFLKKAEFFKRIIKKDNNALVHIKGFKKHFGKEEDCPICITRENKATKRMKILSFNNKCFNNRNNTSYNKKIKNNINFNDLQDDINTKEFHNFFINEINKNNNHDGDILFKKIVFNKLKKKPSFSHFSISPLSLNNKTSQDQKNLFPVIYNYFD